MFEIIEKRELAQLVKLFKIKAPLIAKKRKAGQFVVIRLNERGERIPLTIADSDPVEGTITIIVQEAGRTTSLLSAKNKGDSILDCVGPLGKPTHVEKYGTAVCVGGGIGTAVTYPIGKALKEAGARSYPLSARGRKTSSYSKTKCVPCPIGSTLRPTTAVTAIMGS